MLFRSGTLDPDAEGVLVVCLGKATKLCELLTNKDKSYVATLRLGQTSDTEDASGTILTRKEVTATKEEVLHAIMSFVGSYEQIPPMYSAIKINGKKLYELARMGTVVERTPRTVTIHSIEVIKMELPYVTFRVSCGKGTYIRSLCRDIGEKLGCGGLMEHLVRDCVISERPVNLLIEKMHFLWHKLNKWFVQVSLNRIFLVLMNYFRHYISCM